MVKPVKIAFYVVDIGNFPKHSLTCQFREISFYRHTNKSGRWKLCAVNANSTQFQIPWQILGHNNGRSYWNSVPPDKVAARFQIFAVAIKHGI